MVQVNDYLRETIWQSRVARHNTLPSLDLVMSYSKFGSDGSFSKSTGLDQESWALNLMSTTDLSRTVERLAYEHSLLGVEAAQRSLSLQQDEIVHQVKQELRRLYRAEKRIEIQREQIRQAEGKLELARAKFQRGLADNFNMIEAETELRQAQTNLISVVIEYIIGSYRLRAALGTLIEDPGELDCNEIR